MNRAESPELKLIEKVKYLKPSLDWLANGIPVYLQKGGVQEIVKFELVFKAGSYNQSKTLQAFAAANLLKSGTRNLSASQINESWDFYGASLQVDAQKDIISVGFVCLAKHLEPVLDLLMEMITGPIYPEEELEIFLKNRKQKHLVNAQKVQYMARAGFMELLYGNYHPYGKRLLDKDFDALTKKDLQLFHKRFLHPGNCTGFVSGNFPQNILLLMNRALEKYAWESEKFTANIISEPETTLEQKHFIAKKDAVQSAIRMGKLIINREHPDYHKLAITNTLLGGFFGSRLMRNIRQDKGFTYGINSAIIHLLRSSYFFIVSEVGKEVTQMALEEIYKELRQLRENPATQMELETLRNYLSGSFLRSFDGPFMQSERFKEMLLFGQDYEWFDSYLEILKSFNADDIQQMGAKYLHEDQIIEMVAG